MGSFHREGREGMAEWQAIGTVFPATPPAGAPPALPPCAGAGTGSPHQLTTFPVAVAILLHYVTFCRKGGHYTIKPLGQEPACSEHGALSTARQEP
jgi:hypothetical protein